MRDRGAAAILTVFVAVAVVAAATAGVVPVVQTLVERQRAHSAADAAALAGVVGGHAAAVAVAAANGATLVAWSVEGHRVTVTVRVGEHTVTARATDEPPAGEGAQDRDEAHAYTRNGDRRDPAG